MTAPHAPQMAESADPRPITVFGPDFPFPFDDWIKHPKGLGRLPADRHGSEVAIIGAGMAGMIAAYELMKMGLKPVIYEAARIGGRLRSQAFEGASGIIAELGGMRFPISGTGFYHYVDLLGLASKPFPNPLAAPSTPSTVVDIEGQTHYAEKQADLPEIFQEVAAAWHEALEDTANFAAIQETIRARDVSALKEIWNRLVPLWDDRSFYDFVATAPAFAKRSFHHREVFGQVGSARRLGFGLSQLDARDPARRHHQLRREPALHRRRRRAGAARPVEIATQPDGALAERHLA